MPRTNADRLAEMLYVGVAQMVSAGSSWVDGPARRRCAQCCGAFRGGESGYFMIGGIIRRSLAAPGGFDVAGHTYLGKDPAPGDPHQRQTISSRRAARSTRPTLLYLDVFLRMCIRQRCGLRSWLGRWPDCAAAGGGGRGRRRSIRPNGTGDGGERQAAFAFAFARASPSSRWCLPLVRSECAAKEIRRRDVLRRIPPAWWAYWKPQQCKRSRHETSRGRTVTCCRRRWRWRERISFVWPRL